MFGKIFLGLVALAILYFVIKFIFGHFKGILKIVIVLVAIVIAIAIVQHLGQIVTALGWMIFSIICFVLAGLIIKIINGL